MSLLNCPNCGAPVQKDYCPYCGSVFLDWACFDLNKPTFVKIKKENGDIVLVKLRPRSISATVDYAESVLYADDTPYITMRRPERKIEAEFDVVPFKHYLSKEEVCSILIQPHIASAETAKDVMRGFDDG